MPRQGAGSSDAALVIRKANASAIFPAAQTANGEKLHRTANIKLQTSNCQKSADIKLHTFHQNVSNPKKSKENNMLRSNALAACRIQTLSQTHKNANI